jgi:hypothetical protein
MNIHGSATRKLPMWLSKTIKLSLFSFSYKIREQEGERGPAWGSKYLWERGGKGVGGRIWCKYFIHIYVIEKLIPFETISGMGG